jgi:ABC-type transporter Mla subunit MlaD
LNELQKATQTANGTFATANLTLNDMRNPIKKDLAEMQRTMTEARSLITNLNTVVTSNRYNIDDTLDNFREASENLRQLTMSVRQRPWTLLRGKATPDRQVPAVAGKP